MNPFITTGYAGPEYFCDRIEETKALTDLLMNGNNVALMSVQAGVAVIGCNGIQASDDICFFCFRE